MVWRLLTHLLSEEEQEGAFDQALVRTQLANERPFLVWLRSAVVLVGVALGAIALRSGDIATEVIAFSLGDVTLFTAAVLVVWPYIRFHLTLVDLEKRRYRPARGLVAVATLLFIVNGVVLLTLLVVEVLNRRVSGFSQAAGRTD